MPIKKTWQILTLTGVVAALAFAGPASATTPEGTAPEGTAPPATTTDTATAPAATTDTATAPAATTDTATAPAAPAPTGPMAKEPAYVPPIPMEQCAHPTVWPALFAFGDQNLYSLAPGGAFDDGAGWQLEGGAAISQTVQPDGTTGGVLELPQRSRATSPPMCITVDYPMARLFARGMTGSEDIDFGVIYWKKDEWTKPKNTGKFRGDKRGWGLSKEMNLQPDKNEGWQQVRFVLYSDGKSNVQVDNFWVDPRASR